MKITVIAVLLGLALSGWAYTQSAEHAAIAGNVSDSSGAVLMGASAVLRSKDRGYELRTSTDEKGNFAFDYLSPGIYSLVVQLPRFAPRLIDGIRLTSFQALDLPVVLQVGAPDAVITVTESSEQIDTASSTVRETLPRSAIEQLPVITDSGGRSVLSQLSLLFPGASSFRQTGQVDAFGVYLSINGSTSGGVGFYFDGIDNNWIFEPGSATFGPNPDALEGLSVISENSAAAGYQSDVHWRTRSGTNRLHGQARVMNFTPNLQARDFFAAQSGAGFKTNAAGFQLSGPVVLPLLYDGHNRTFWFFDTEWTRSQQTFWSNYSFPTDAVRSGDFSSLPQALWPVDPTTGKPFPNGQVPANRILPQSRFYIDQFMPRDPDGAQIAQPSEYRPTGWQFTTRMDHHLRSSDTISASLFLHRNPEKINDNSTLDNSLSLPERGHNLSVQYVHAVSAQATNSCTFGHTSWIEEYMTDTKFPDVDLKDRGYNITNIASGARGYPNVRLDSQSFSPAGYRFADDISTSDWRDDFSLVRRSHNWKFGAELRRAESNWVSSTAAPAFTFARLNPSGTGNDFADFLLGIPVSYSQGSDDAMLVSRLMGSIYVQDSVKLRKNLTLNFGLRYEYSGAITELNGHVATFRPGAQSNIFPNAPSGILFKGDLDPLSGDPLSSAITPASGADFGPRVGFAWSPGFQEDFLGRLFGGPGQTSIRAGYGMYHVPSPADPMYGNWYMPPWSFSVQRDRSTLDASGGTFLNPWGTDTDPFAGPIDQRQFHPPLQSVIYVDPSLRDPYQYQWDLSIQRRLPKETALDVTYAGNRTLHLGRTFQANPGQLIAGANVYNVDSRRVYKNFGSVSGYVSDGSSLYNALQVTVSRRFSSRLLFNLHYVWSKALDDAEGFNGALADRVATPWGRTSADVRHVFAGYWVLGLPGIERVRLLKHATAGWRLSGAIQLRSGLPLQIQNPFDSTLQGLGPGMPDITGQFRAFDPREVHTFKLPNGQTVTGNFLFDPTVFQIVNPQSPEAARIGNLGRNVFSGAGVAQVDFSLAKEFRIIKEHRLETRIDATNGLNHAQFLVNRAAVSLNGAMFGRVASTLGPRRVQFQLRYNF